MVCKLTKGLKVKVLTSIYQNAYSNKKKAVIHVTVKNGRPLSALNNKYYSIERMMEIWFKFITLIKCPTRNLVSYINQIIVLA